jgi:putative ABC transport system permease protein
MLERAQRLAAAFERPAALGTADGWLRSINIRIALRNFARDRIRFAITIAGVTFSVVLMALQMALLIGFAVTSSSLVDHSTADYWVMPKGTRNVDQAGEIDQASRYRARSVAGVANVTEMFVRFLPWKRPDGGIEVVNVVGIDPAAPAVVPWNFVEGSISSLKWPDGVIVDLLYAEKLGVKALGDTVEINGHRARVVGLTSGIRAFTQSPYVFTSFKTAHTFAGADRDRTSFLLIKAEDDRAGAGLRAALASRLWNYDVLDTSTFSRNTRAYWLFTTGAGAALVIAAVLGLIVGMVIVGQTLYAATMEHLREYATLRAIGAEHGYLRAIILKQSCFSGLVGYSVGTLIASFVVFLSRDSTASLVMPLSLSICIGFVTFAMCGCAALISIRRLAKLDPAMVFK